MVPLGRVNDLALEGIHALEIGERRHVQGTTGQHPVLTDHLGAIRQVQGPQGCPVIKTGSGHFRIETGVLTQRMFVAHALDVIVNFLLATVAMAPLRVTLKREGIHV